MSTISPEPFPVEGVRKLSIKEGMQRLSALACTAPKDNRPSCSGQVHVGIFFDGTGNNMQADYEIPPPEKRKHSNIVKLFQTHKLEPSQGFLRYYMPGVGTNFPAIGDSGGTRGAASAAGGEQRIIWALCQLINAPHTYVTGNPLVDPATAKTISNNLSDSTSPGALRRTALAIWQDKLKSALEGKKPRVEQINLSVFGFSRGAAQARVFVNWLFELCKQEGGGWTFSGLPIRVSFLGLFDTVASVGAADLINNGLLSGHQSWADNNLEIHPAVEQCVHYVAGHEVRACFPLDSVRVKSSYPANAVEVMYPGAHSDVGGGYAPGELGVSPTPESSMSIIPGVNMYRAAYLAGVPLTNWEGLQDEIKRSLTPSAQTITDFNAYLKDARIGIGPVEDMHRRHMALYFSQRFKHRAEFFNRAPYTAAVSKEQRFLKATQDLLMQKLRQFGQGDPLAPDFDPARASSLYKNSLRALGLQETLADKHLNDVARAIDVKALTPAIETFLDRYIHDSMAGFMGMLNEYLGNGIGFVKFRTVFKGND